MYCILCVRLERAIQFSPSFLPCTVRVWLCLTRISSQRKHALNIPAGPYFPYGQLVSMFRNRDGVHEILRGPREAKSETTRYRNELPVPVLVPGLIRLGNL